MYITFKMSCSSPCTTKHPTLSADALSCIVIFTRWCPHATLSIITQDTSGCRCFQQYTFCKRGRLCPQSCALIHAVCVCGKKSLPTAEPCHILVRSQSCSFSDTSKGLVSNTSPFPLRPSAQAWHRGVFRTAVPTWLQILQRGKNKVIARLN